VNRWQIRLGSWEQFGSQAREIRFEVFVAEQGVPAELEVDRYDPVCVHALAIGESARAVGTGRLLPDGHIGRMAVLREVRSTGVGAALLRELMQAARRRGDRRVELSSQVHAKDFYLKFGFSVIGEPYEDAGIAHIMMRAELPAAD